MKKSDHQLFEDEVLAANQQYAGKRIKSDKKQLQFSCQNCGSAIIYEIGSNCLTCPSCQSSEAIEESGKIIKEYSLDKALTELHLRPLSTPETIVTCDNCGASSKWQYYTQSDLCPYCRTPIAKLDTLNNRLQIEAIVPFHLDQSVAIDAFSQWIKKRWFAPNVLKQMAGYSTTFRGVYIPHWTFDSLTYTDYEAQRGEDYTDYVTETRLINGERRTVTTPVIRTRWYRAVGQVRLMFDDVLVLASMVIPKVIVNKLQPWDLRRAEPYTPEYLAGLTSQYYQLKLDEAFIIAQQKMTGDIDRAVRLDIGGDRQRIHHKKTRYQNSTYKLILLPVWYSAFAYKGKQYQTVINGQTGKTEGQYPKSPTKIVFAVIVAIILLLTTSYFITQHRYTL
ncbi:MAG: primosomal protein N' (replication factor Y) - superfamily II helicase [Ostreibacterium sp.]